MPLTAPTGECCDNCTRRAARARQVQSSDSGSLDAPSLRGPVPPNQAVMTPEERFSPANWRSFLHNVKRKEVGAAHAASMLKHWRRLTWWKTYGNSPFGAPGILSDDDIATLAARHTYATLDDLRELGWLLVDEHGPEVLAVLALVDMPTALAELDREKKKYMAEQEEVCRRELAKLEAMRQKREREEEKERKRRQKEVEAAQRKERTEQRKRESARKKAKTWFAQAAKLARRGFPDVKPRPRKRKAADEEPEARPAKCVLGDEENVAPVAASASSAPIPSSRPQPRPRRLPRSSASSSGCTTLTVQPPSANESAVLAPSSSSTTSSYQSIARHPSFSTPTVTHISNSSTMSSSLGVHSLAEPLACRSMRWYPTPEPAHLASPPPFSLSLQPPSYITPDHTGHTSSSHPPGSLASFGGFNGMVRWTLPCSFVLTNVCLGAINPTLSTTISDYTLPHGAVHRSFSLTFSPISSL